MLVCTICICQNQQSTILPSTVEKNNSPSLISLQNDKINLRNHQLNEIWQYLVEYHAVEKILDIFLNAEGLNESINNEKNTIKH